MGQSRVRWPVWRSGSLAHGLEYCGGGALITPKRNVDGVGDGASQLSLGATVDFVAGKGPREASFTVTHFSKWGC